MMRSIDMIYYNDSPKNVRGTTALPSSFPAHPDITERMAKVFGLSFFSGFQLKKLNIDEDDDMVEDLTDRIRGVLRDYHSEQAFTEFLANAEDAGARRFAMALDTCRSFGTKRLLTKSMGAYQNEALIIFNDAVFQEGDFKGIRRVGLGGKRGKENTIGRFGLGSLSMFHFSEVIYGVFEFIVIY
jgi:hypothetical protein